MTLVLKTDGVDALGGAGGLWVPVSWTADDASAGLPEGWRAEPLPDGTLLTASQWRSHGAGGVTLGVLDDTSNPYDMISAHPALNILSCPWLGESIDAVMKFTGIDFDGVGLGDTWHAGGVIFGICGRTIDLTGGDGYCEAEVVRLVASAGNSGDPAWRAQVLHRPHTTTSSTAVGGSASEVVQEGQTPSPSVVLLRVVADSTGVQFYWSTTEAAETDGDHVSWTEITTAPLRTFRSRPGGLRLYGGVYTNFDIANAVDRATATLAGFTVLGAA